MNTSSITTIFFDLDGTLLPFDEIEFFDTYISLFAKKCKSYGLDETLGVNSLLAGFKRMLANDGKITNEKVFWNTFFEQLGYQDEQLYSFLIDFYTHEFTYLQTITKMNPLAALLIGELKEKGYPLVLATNPVFPKIGTLERLRWAGLEGEDFALITTYEEFFYTKSHPGYYRQLCDKVNVDPKNVLMIGNDVEEDGLIFQLGAQLLLIEDCLINRDNRDLSHLRVHPFSQIYEVCKALPTINS